MATMRHQSVAQRDDERGKSHEQRRDRNQHRHPASEPAFERRVEPAQEFRNRLCRRCAVDCRRTNGLPHDVLAGQHIANAVFDATGVRVRDVPLTPERVRAALIR